MTPEELGMAENHVVAVSGGKDSVAMALRLREMEPDTPFMFVCTPTGDELPPMVQHMERVEALLGQPIIRLTSTTLEELIVEQGMIPNWRARFCTRILKIEPFLDFVNGLDGPTTWHVGLRADEEERDGVKVSDGRDITIRYPLREWGWGLEEVMRYLEARGVEIPPRTDCGACFFQRLDEWHDLWTTYPDIYQGYIDIEERMGHTFRSPGRDTWPAALKDLRREFLSGRTPRRRKGRANAACSFCAR